MEKTNLERLNSFLTFLLFFVLFFLYFTSNNAHLKTADEDGHHEQEQVVEIPDGESPPAVDAEVIRDRTGSWLLHVGTEGFTFTPEKVGTNDVRVDEGHAHLYVNGKKINRLYGDYYNLGELEPGEHVIKVSLHANNHGVFVYGGKEIADVVKVDVNKVDE